MNIGILFDLDGTLLNTLEDLHDAVNAVLDSMHYPRRSLEETRRFVGNGARRLLELAVPEGGDLEEALRRFQSYYPAHCRIKTAPYPGIVEALGELSQRHPVAIVSNKPDAAVKPLCADYFPGIFSLGEAAGCPRKPAPDMVYQALAAIGADTCIYVGDSEVDVQTAQNAGVPCLSVTWGFRKQEEITGGTHFCHRTDRLVPTLEEMLEALWDGK